MNTTGIVIEFPEGVFEKLHTTVGCLWEFAGPPGERGGDVAWVGGGAMERTRRGFWR